MYGLLCHGHFADGRIFSPSEPIIKALIVIVFTVLAGAPTCTVGPSMIFAFYTGTISPVGELAGTELMLCEGLAAFTEWSMVSVNDA